MNIFGADYTLDLSFSIGDVVMVVLAVLAFRIQKQMKKMADSAVEVEKVRSVYKVKTLMNEAVVLMEMRLPLPPENASILLDESAKLEQHHEDMAFRAIGEFLDATSMYCELMVLEFEEEGKVTPAELDKCVEIAKECRDIMPL